MKPNSTATDSASQPPIADLSSPVSPQFLDEADELLQQETQLEEKRKSVIAGLISQREQITQKLANLGLRQRGRPVSTGDKPSKRSSGKASVHCKYCDIDGHDGRAHRSQGKHKKAFTTAELADLAAAK